MAESDTPLADVIEEVVATLASETTGPDRVELLERLEILRHLDLSNTDFSPEAFLRAEVQRALGV